MLNIRIPLHFGATLSLKHLVDYSQDPTLRFMPDHPMDFQPGPPDFNEAPDRYMTELVKVKMETRDTLAGIDDKVDPLDIAILAADKNVVATLSTRWNGEHQITRMRYESARDFMNRVLTFAIAKSKSLMFAKERGKTMVNQLQEHLTTATDYAFERLPSIDHDASIHAPKIKDALRHTKEFSHDIIENKLDFGLQKLEITRQNGNWKNDGYWDSTTYIRTNYTLSLSNNPNDPTITFTTIHGEQSCHPIDCKIDSVLISQPSQTKGREAEQISMVSSDRGETFQYKACESLGGQALFDDPIVTERLVSMKNRCRKLIQSLKAIPYLKDGNPVSI